MRRLRAKYGTERMSAWAAECKPPPTCAPIGGVGTTGKSSSALELAAAQRRRSKEVDVSAHPEVGAECGGGGRRIGHYATPVLSYAVSAGDLPAGIV